jgi:hypothetical protein
MAWIDDCVPVVGKKNPGGQQESVFRAALAYDSRETCESGSASNRRFAASRQLTKKNRSDKTKRRRRDMIEHCTPIPGKTAQTAITPARRMKATRRFAEWCAARGISELAAVQPSKSPLSSKNFRGNFLPRPSVGFRGK